ncbi:MAG TPA: hypothetical protein VIN07_01855, partial [Flavipsychrobacter sp.]
LVLRYYSVIFFLLFVVPSTAQDECDWKKDEYNIKAKPTHVFNIVNKSLGFYGWEHSEYNDIKEKCYSEAVLYDCKTKEVIFEWDATQNCSVVQKQDTIVITEYYLLAVGDDMNLVWKPFYVTKVYLQKNQTKRFSYFLLNSYHYNAEQIKTTINIYTSTTRDKYPWNSEEQLKIAYQLQWAYISGSKEAGNLLEMFEEKFGPFDGAIAEEFNEIFVTYQHIKKLKLDRNND